MIAEDISSCHNAVGVVGHHGDVVGIEKEALPWKLVVLEDTPERVPRPILVTLVHDAR